MPDFEQQLLGAWRVAGLDASPRPDGSGVTFCCPVCVSPVRLELADGIVNCPVCSWGASGQAWEIAKAGAEVKPAAATSDGLPLLDLSRILAYEPDEKEEIWPGGILSAGMPTAIVGAPGVGKSRLSLQAALCTILGKSFFGWETRGEGLKWLFLQTENSTRRLKADLWAMTRTMTDDARKRIGASLRILDVMAMDFASICMTDGHPDRVRILRTLEDWRPDIVTIDPLRDAGQGDPNKDGDMTATCKGIASVIRLSNPRRAPLVIHHGRTGASEASKVFGDDSASFGRNSKVLYGWLRSQINVALAGVEHPGVIIVGCGKCSDGPKWKPFAARLDENTMTYRRLESSEFNLAEWEDKMKAGATKRRRELPDPDEVAGVLRDVGGEAPGAVNASGGLVSLVRAHFNVTKADAQTAVEAAVIEGSIATVEEVSATPQGGGKAKRHYVLRLPLR